MPISPQLMQLLQARGVLPDPNAAPPSGPVSSQTLAQLQQLGWAPAPNYSPAAAPPAQTPASDDAARAIAGLNAAKPSAPSLYLPPTTISAPGPMGHTTPRASKPYNYEGPEIAPSGPPAPAVFATAPGGPEQVKMPTFQGKGYGVTYVPDRDVSTVGPNERAAMDKALEGRKGVYEEIVKAETGANEAAANSDEYLSTMAAIEAARAQGNESRRDRAMRGQEAEYKRLLDESARGHAEYDRRSTGKRVAGAVFMALNALGNSIQGRPDAPNLAKEIIDKSIDADYRQQLDALGQKHEAARGQGELLARMRERFGDERASEAGFRAMRWQQYAAEANARAKRAQSPVLEAQSKMLRAMADLETAKWDIESHKWMPGGAVAGGGPTAAQVRARAQKLYDDAVAGNRPVTWEQAYGEAVHEAGMGSSGSSADVFGKVPEGEKDKVQTPADVPLPHSTNWEPWRKLQGTQAFADVNAQNRYNVAIATAVVAKMGRGAERSPEMVKRFASAYEIHPGDSQATINMKVSAARRDFPGFAASTGGPSAADLGATPLGGK